MDPPRAQAIVGPYVLVERLGAGGVGEVWKARDRQLNRVVALKFIDHLRQGFGGQAARPAASAFSDLLREARAASALNHPNIITIFEVGEREGSTYLAMEFVEGETLRDRLTRGPVPLDEAVDITGQIVDGLASAHAQGIIHRDLKPENIMIRIDGYVKLVDFGLAKVLAFDDGTTGPAGPASRSGQLAGTFSYMSPEQARSRPVTPATDVFSLGIVIYELLTGEHPFRRDTVLDTLNAIVGVEPAPVREKTPSVPRALSDVVATALRKDPTERHASAIALKEPLKRIRALPDVTAALTARPTAPPRRRRALFAAAAMLALLLSWSVWTRVGGPSAANAAGPVRSVAIMTFRSDASDPLSSALAEGLPEDLGGALSTAGFRVVSRGSVVALGPSADAAAAGSSLGVDAIVEGSVRGSNDKFRVHLELVSTRTRFQIWSGTFSVAGDELAGNSQAVLTIAQQIRAGAGR